jgi:hypothetical protein
VIRALALALACLAAVAATSCDPRAILAQSNLFSGVREGLIQDCCNCLARRGTRAPGSSCGEAAVGPDGGIVVEEGAEVAPDDAEFQQDDMDDVVDDNEIPCSCGLNANQCVNQLSKASGRLLVPGACIDQPNNVWDAPCEDACAQVVTFDPISTE